jgi:hypothetical protein
MNIKHNTPNIFEGLKPQYTALSKQSPDSEFMVTVGVAWKLKDSDTIVLRLDLIPTKWDGTILLTRNKKERGLPT